MTKIEVWTRLKGDDEFLMECILVLYELQTASEKISKSTNETNRVGFNKGDASFLINLALKIKPFLRDKKEWLTLTSDELYLAREKMEKYSQQLANIFASNDGDVA